MATFRREKLTNYKVCRRTRIRNMATSLIGMFGDAALLVARGQSAKRDVGGNCGIVWCELADAIGLILTSEGQSRALPIEPQEPRTSSADGPTIRETFRRLPMTIRHGPGVGRSECFGSYVI